MAVFDFLFTMHALDVGRNKFQRARAVERNHGDDIIDILWPHLHHVAGHSRAFQLEDARGMAFADEFEGFRIVDGDIIQAELYPHAAFQSARRRAP